MISERVGGIEEEGVETWWGEEGARIESCPHQTEEVGSKVASNRN
jgi:hypothetical protein